MGNEKTKQKLKSLDSWTLGAQTRDRVVHFVSFTRPFTQLNTLRPTLGIHAQNMLQNLVAQNIFILLQSSVNTSKV